MGLDMYLTGRKNIGGHWQNPKVQEVRKEDGYLIEDITVSLGYWRKHRKLHGYIVNTFADGVDECQEIYLSAKDLQKIIEALRSGELPETEGFYFGNEEIDEEEKKHTEEYIGWLENAIKWLEAPRHRFDTVRMLKNIYYQASW